MSWMTSTTHSGPTVICIGAGPAGLTAAYILSEKKTKVLVLEQDENYVGGIARTVNYRGCRIDIGGHRFFSKSAEVKALWREFLGPDLLERSRKSRIYYRNRFFDYPLRPLTALRSLGFLEATACVTSYLRAQLFPVRDPRNFEDWVINRFGQRLFRIFFQTYTEKVWGMRCTEISADWATQRIQQLSLWRAIIGPLIDRFNVSGRRINAPKTLIDRFHYPRLGPGMMWEAAVRRITDLGGEIRMGAKVTGLQFDAANGLWHVSCACSDGTARTVSATHVISSAPLRDVIRFLQPIPSHDARQAAAGLRYRNFFVVGLIVRDAARFDDNWIYVHDPNVKVGRIQNFKAWSPHMVPDAALACYGMEYFCSNDDALWRTQDSALVEMAGRELIALGLAENTDILDGCVIRQENAYPVYDQGYKQRVDLIRKELEAFYSNLHLVGRSGMHRYNNQDHSMMTALLTAKNILAKKKLYDIWRVNQDAEYHEVATSDELLEASIADRMVPRKAS
jgi:protoporphyrinogen oxidase